MSEATFISPTATYKTLGCVTEQGVTTLMLRQPPLNIMTVQMMRDLSDALTVAEKSPSCKVVLIRGEGKCFSSGADVKEHLPGQEDVLIQALHRVCVTLLSMSVPTVSAVHGVAMGGAFELATLCDITLASAMCRLGLPEIRLGVFPPVAAAIYPRWIGCKQTLDLLLTGREITADEARRIGLVNDVFPEENFDQQVRATVATLASHSRAATRACKKAVRWNLEPELSQALNAAELIYLRETMRTADAAEGLKAFMEKRRPVWSER